MEQKRVYYSLYGRLLNLRVLYLAYRKVNKAKGAAGIDGQSLSNFAEDLRSNLEQLLHELKTRQYKPQPVRRVEIPKEGGGIRLLGIPTVRDRIVQQALTDLLTPIFDPHFHPSSYGYRPGRSCHQAITKATLFIRKYGRQHVVDMDLSKCFDKLDHELIVNSVKARVTDGSILKLLRKILSSGVMIEGKVESTEVGSPQGGVISPLLANIYLDAFDQKMMKRNLRIVRYADDILILCGSVKAASHARQVATEILENELKLQVNREKTHIAHSDEGVKFLGVEIGSRYTRLQRKKLANLKLRVKALTRRNGGKALSDVLKALNPLLRGFGQYFQIANCSREFKMLARWIRRRLRSIQLRLWKKPGRLHRRLKQLNYKPPFQSVNLHRWSTSRSPLASYAMPNKWFEEQGLFGIDQLRTGVLSQSY